MNVLNWELDVLSRAVAYQNLSGASSHVGISQPQLSRIVAKLETETKLSLLSRESKRHAVWTPEAYKLADLYRRIFRDFSVEAQGLREGALQSIVRIGILEGQADVALAACRNLFLSGKFSMIELDVYDLPDLEERYFGGRLDLVFTLREPGRKKPKYLRVIGYQTVDLHGSSSGIEVRSLFEQATAKGPNRGKSQKKNEQSERIFTSNSLAIRERWIRDHNGFGNLPSKIHTVKKRVANELPVLLIGNDGLGQGLWDLVLKAV